MKNKQIIGVLGGMGPQASNELYRLLIEGARIRYGASHNDDYPEILLDSVPVPDGFSRPETMERVARMLEDRSVRLSTYGATMIAMACNTVCIYADRLQRKTSAAVVSTADEVVSEISGQHNCVLLLSSSTSLKLRLYQEKFDRNRIRYITPDVSDYPEMDAIVSGVLAGDSAGLLTERLLRLTEKLLTGAQAQAIILGCTELPLIFPKEFRLPVYSSLSILAESLLKRYYKEEYER